MNGRDAQLCVGATLLLSLSVSGCSTTVNVTLAPPPDLLPADGATGSAADLALPGTPTTWPDASPQAGSDLSFPVAPDLSPVCSKGCGPSCIICPAGEACVAGACGYQCPASMSGLGLPAQPCVVTSCVQLQAINQAPALVYTLGNDVDCSATATWNPGFVPLDGRTPFDGANHVINGLVLISAATRGHVGLFSTAVSISSLGLTNVQVTSTAQANVFVGGMVGYMGPGSVLSNCFVTGTVSGPTPYTVPLGGLIGKTEGDVTGCRADVTVNGATQNGLGAGGLIGVAYGGTVSDCEAHGILNASGGGLIGSANFNVVKDSFADVDITTTTNNAGLVAGVQGVTISNCFATGTSLGGGLVNSISNGGTVTITNSFWWAGGGASGCLSNQSVAGCAQISNAQGKSYFYDVSHEPMASWSFPAWATSCSPSAGLPVLAAPLLASGCAP